jgi:hypothetical protein
VLSRVALLKLLSAVLPHSPSFSQPQSELGIFLTPTSKSHRRT